MATCGQGAPGVCQWIYGNRQESPWRLAVAAIERCQMNRLQQIQNCLAHTVVRAMSHGRRCLQNAVCTVHVSGHSESGQYE